MKTTNSKCRHRQIREIDRPTLTYSRAPPLPSPQWALVIHCAGVGTRNYYRKLGYELEGPYMVKHLEPFHRPWDSANYNYDD